MRFFVSMIMGQMKIDFWLHDDKLQTVKAWSGILAVRVTPRGSGERGNGCWRGQQDTRFLKGRNSHYPERKVESGGHLPPCFAETQPSVTRTKGHRLLGGRVKAPSAAAAK